MTGSDGVQQSEPSRAPAVRAMPWPERVGSITNPLARWRLFPVLSLPAGLPPAGREQSRKIEEAG